MIFMLCLTQFVYQPFSLFGLIEGPDLLGDRSWASSDPYKISEVLAFGLFLYPPLFYPFLSDPSVLAINITVLLLVTSNFL